MKPRSPLPPRRAYLKRGKPPRAKGGSRFPKRRDLKYWAWLGGQRCISLCDACKWWRPLQRAHLKAKGSGGDDRNNISLLCLDCHEAQEKRTAAFIRETGVDLYAEAKAHTARYLAEHPEENP